MKKTTEEESIVDAFAGKKILVVGDVMLDEYIWGAVERISPEAPVPVVRVNKETWVPGGAANVANNIRALGGDAVISGVIGDDASGKKLEAILRGLKIDVRGLITDRNRPTVTKSRILAGHQQVARIDREEIDPVAASAGKELIGMVESLVDEVDGIILEDYAKGVIGQELIDCIAALATDHRKLLVADPNGANLFSFRGAALVTPNRKEAVLAAGIGQGQTVEALGEALLRKWGSEAVLITLGEEGMCLFEPGQNPYLNPTMAREVFDVSGAGDTVVASITLSLAAGADLRRAVHISNCAAGVVVGKLGTAVVTASELKDILRRE